MLSFIDVLTKEMDHEAVTTRKMLQRVPDQKFDWKPHEKSMTLRRLATHIAELPGWVTMVVNTSELDFSKSDYKPAVINSTGELLEQFEKSFAGGRKALSNTTEAQLEEPWTLRNGEKVYSVSPKIEVIRMAFCQTVHHRAQLGVFLRLLDVPIPGSYGPSADEPDM